MAVVCLAEQGFRAELAALPPQMRAPLEARLDTALSQVDISTPDLSADRRRAPSR